ncbi:MAG TPA: hypothetical protein VGU72_09115 [Beijerinckiaceae bacterium]|nr:hypothetical protein [Beijerinckiaceae bacterium]
MRLTTGMALAGTMFLIGTGASIAQEVYVQPRQRTIVREYIQVDPYNQRTVVREREYIRQPSMGQPVTVAPYSNEMIDTTPRPPRNIRNIEAVDPSSPYLRDRPVVIEQRRVIVDPNDGHVVEVLE